MTDDRRTRLLQEILYVTVDGDITALPANSDGRFLPAYLLRQIAAVLATEGDQPTPRPETGPMQFGDDWPGLFIRGDNAAGYSLALNMAIDATKDPLTLAQLRSLRSLLVGCDVRNSPEVQHARIVPRPDPPVQP